MPSCTPIHRCILEQEAEGGFTASALQYEPRPPFLQSAFAVMCLLLATTPIASGTYTRTATYASLHVTPFVAQQWNLCSPPIPHTHTHTQSVLVFSMLASFPGLTSFPSCGEGLGTRFTLPGHTRDDVLLTST